MKRLTSIDALKHKLIVSVQAPEGHALRDSYVIARMAAAAVDGGAAAIRCGGAGGIADIEAVRSIVDVPIIGLTKQGNEGVFITPSLAEVKAVMDAGADIVAFDGTRRDRRDGSSIADAVRIIREQGRFSMADVSTCAEGIAAHAAGVDIIGTTLAGYTEYTPYTDGPDLDLVSELRRQLPDAFLIAEGRYTSPELCAAALANGASTVVVGTAITDVMAITRTFAASFAAH